MGGLWLVVRPALTGEGGCTEGRWRAMGPGRAAQDLEVRRRLVLKNSTPLGLPAVLGSVRLPPKWQPYQILAVGTWAAVHLVAGARWGAFCKDTGDPQNSHPRMYPRYYP